MVQKNIAQIMAAAQDAIRLIDMAAKTGSQYAIEVGVSNYIEAAIRLIDMAAKTGSQYAVEVGVSNYIEAVTDKVVLFQNLTNEQQDMFTLGTYIADRDEFYNDLNAVAFSVP